MLAHGRAVQAISIHAPVKGATANFFRPFHFQQDFNPRTREGCDIKKLQEEVNKLKISIHAPVKGATATHGIPTQMSIYFNPRTREGCDPRTTTSRSLSTSHFNPRTREGCDQFLFAVTESLPVFQSTHP